MRLSRYIIAAACLLGIHTASAQAPLLTLQDAIAATLKNNYDIQLLRNDSSLYALNQSFANAALLPRINASGAIVFNNNNQKQRLADGTERKQSGIRSSNLQSSINLNWTIFDGFKMFISRDKLQEFINLGNLSIRNQLTTSISDVTKLYYNIIRQKQQLKAIEEQMGINEERVKQAEKKLSVGLGAKPEVLQAKLDLNAQKAARLKQITLIEQLKEQLNQLTVFSQGTVYEVPDSIPIRTDLTMGDILSDAAMNNPELQLQKQQIKLANMTLLERKAERFPTVNFNSAYNFSRNNNKLVLNSFTPLLNQNAGFNYGLSVNIPIFNNYTVKRNIKAAQIEIDYQQLLYEYKQSTLQISISNAYKTYELQKRTLALEEENILLAKENVYIALERYRLGLSTMLELRETQKSLEDAYNRLITARYDTKVAETDLLRLKGELVK